jgi:hypothetical protein
LQGFFLKKTKKESNPRSGSEAIKKKLMKEMILISFMAISEKGTRYIKDVLEYSKGPDKLRTLFFR